MNKREALIENAKEKFIDAFADYYDYVSHPFDIHQYIQQKVFELEVMAIKRYQDFDEMCSMPDMDEWELNYSDYGTTETSELPCIIIYNYVILTIR